MLSILTPPPSSSYQLHPSITSIRSMSHLHQLHSQLIRLDLLSHNRLLSHLIKFSSLSDDPTYSLRLLLSLPHPDPFLFNTLLRTRNPAHLYTRMLSLSVLPNSFTFPSLLARVADGGGDLGFGVLVHAHVVKFGFWGDGYASNGLINMYLRFGRVAEAGRVFATMGEDARNVVTWTTLVAGCARLGMVDEARKVFDEMPERNSVSWNAMIAGYVQAEQFREAFNLFDRMRNEGIRLNKYVAATMLSACTGLGALDQGRWIHRYIEKCGIKLDAKLATASIDMYAKCGCLEKACDLFNSLPVKGQSSWNCMIGGLAIHGQGEAAIDLFKEMERSMVKPDGITLSNVLSACAHSGLVDKGKYYFNYMVETYGIEPRMEHFGCLVDMLGRAGMFDEAKKVIDEMPMDPDARVLGALLGACKIYKNIDLGEEIGFRVVELDPNNSGRYILLANLYASAGRWDDVASIRRLMNDRKVSKERGWSMIESDGVVNEFVSCGRSHGDAKVDEMLDKIRLAEGYVPDNGDALHDVDDDEKENLLRCHSEKLAIAFGLLKTRRGETIRISKNLMVCRDCHEVSKLVSKVFDRTVVVRDRNRFHHFRNGRCSCKDYW